MTVRLNHFQIQFQSTELARKFITGVVEEIKAGARDILAFGPYTTGKLMTGLESRITYGPYLIEGRVGIPGRRFKYAASVEGGAKRHRIPLVPKPYGRWLVFYWRRIGKVVYAKQVNHPGQIGKAYLRIPLLVVAPRHNMKVFIYDI
jgi:hypothetical protein